MARSSLLSFVGRALFIAIFVGSSYEKVANFDKDTGGPLAGVMAPKLQEFVAKVKEYTGVHVPISQSDIPKILLTAAVCEGLGAALFVMDIAFGAIVMLVFLIPTSIIMHNFWDAASPKMYQLEMIHFMKNLSMIGALLMYLGSGAGTTVEERRQKKNSKPTHMKSA